MIEIYKRTVFVVVDFVAFGVIAVVVGAVVDVRVSCLEIWYRMNTTRRGGLDGRGGKGGGVYLCFYRHDRFFWEGYLNAIV